jgi:hypothetical protein
LVTVLTDRPCGVIRDQQRSGAISFSIWEWTCPPKIRWVPIVAMVLLAEPSAAQPVTAIIGWISCVAEAAKRLAQGPDLAELVIKAALLACPDEKN